jgi:tRNA1Val (adenine37-N6)-methyltransferase
MINTKPFQMKQFAVAHDQCAMRVNTDGCLLGAVAAEEVQPENVKRILDIGTGSGVIALQMAQRFPKAYVDGVEIHGPSARQATNNFKNSPFRDRLVCYHESLQEFELNHQYDIITANPPYFEDGPTRADQGIAAARHALTLDFKTLAQSAAQLLKPNGSFWVILPCDRSERFLDEAMDEGMHLSRIIRIHPKEGREANRCIFGLCKTTDCDPVRSTITLYDNAHQYTRQSREILSPFYASL